MIYIITFSLFCLLFTAPPVIIQDKDTFRSAVEGDDVVLDCEVDGDPPPAIVWLQDGVSLQELYLPAITVHDVGRGKVSLSFSFPFKVLLKYYRWLRRRCSFCEKGDLHVWACSSMTFLDGHWKQSLFHRTFKDRIKIILLGSLTLLSDITSL